jgi:type II secretory pathway pseudopilin PulG
VKFAIQRRESKRSRQPLRRPGRRDEGYILLTLMLVVALMGIFTMAAASKIDFEIRRDKELEMVHRGVQYSRAIRGYYKKFGRYPTKLDDLDNTNNLRYLRKHYKDPLNKNLDFKLLHFGDPGVTLAGGIAGGNIAGATPAGSPGALNGSGQSGSAFGSGSGSGAFGGGSTLGGSSSGFGNSGVNSSGVFAQTPGLGTSSSSATGANSNSQTTAGQSGTTPAAGTDPSQASTPGAGGEAQGDANSSGQQLISSGPIVGVASLCKKDTIREYNKKKKYNEWQFVYDPTFDRGGIITTPYQPSLVSGNLGQNNLQPGSTNGSSSSQSPFGQSSSGQSSFGQSSFGQSSGQSSFGQSSFGNNSNGGSTTPAPPATTSTSPQ